jgi:predicted RNase H-like HicB family nuclease
MELSIVVEREEDGRWIAEIADLPGVLVYGASQQDALEKVNVLALRVIADLVENKESTES